VRVVQPATGARFTTDPVLLAHFVVRTCSVRARRVCDLGAGTGVLGLCIAALDARAVVTGIELSGELASLAARSAAATGVSARVRCEAADLRTVAAPPGGYDLVVCNPPYHAAGAGQLSPGPGRAVARHQIGCSLADVVQAARRLAAPRGRLALVYPAERAADLCTTLASERFRLRALRFVHPRAGAAARLVLALAQLGVRPGTGCRVHPPLLLHEGSGWSQEAVSILDGTC